MMASVTITIKQHHCPCHYRWPGLRDLRCFCRLRLFSLPWRWRWTPPGSWLTTLSPQCWARRRCWAWWPTPISTGTRADRHALAVGSCGRVATRSRTMQKDTLLFPYTRARRRGRTSTWMASPRSRRSMAHRPDCSVTVTTTKSPSIQCRRMNATRTRSAHAPTKKVGQPSGLTARPW